MAELDASKLKLMFEKKEAIRKLSVQRQTEEKALADEYKVDECNAKRNALAKRYAVQIQALWDEIGALERDLGTAA